MAPRRIESLYAVSCYVEIIAESIQKVNKNCKKHSDFRKKFHSFQSGSIHLSLGQFQGSVFVIVPILPVITNRLLAPFRNVERGQARPSKSQACQEQDQRADWDAAA